MIDEEVKAVQILTTSIRSNPQSYTILLTQCEFLRSKGKYEWALELARQAVNCAPSEFVTWEKLAEVYMDLKDYGMVIDHCVSLLWTDIIIMNRPC